MADQPIPEVPAGMMRVWDAEQKKIILVADPAAEPDRITFTMRVHDAAEKNDAAKSTSWVSVEVARADLKMKQVDFLTKYVAPHLAALTQLELS